MIYNIVDIKTDNEIKLKDLPNCPHIGEHLVIKQKIPNKVTDLVMEGNVISVSHYLYVDNYKEPFVSIEIA